MIKKLGRRWLLPWDENERKLLILTTVALLLDAASTLLMKHYGRISCNYIEINPVVDMMHKNLIFGVFIYNSQWIFVILFFRVIRSVEFALSILHITSNGIAALDNISILLFRRPFIKSLLELFGLRMKHVLLVVFLTYLLFYFFWLSKIHDSRNLIKKGFVIVLCIFFALIVQFGITYIWIRHLYIFFW